MSRVSYQYGTSPRKYEQEYIAMRKKDNDQKKKELQKEQIKKDIKKSVAKKKAKKNQEITVKFSQLVLVFMAFGMLLTLSLREIAIMEMFNQKKDLENQLAVIQKENGQVEKSITEVESTLDWNSIQQKATDELGMQKKSGIPVDLDRLDNVETSNKLIKEEETSIIEKIISFFINKF